LRNEDWLCEQIIAATSRNCEYSILFEDVRYEYLSKSFIDFLCESFDILTISIWNSLRSRLLSGPSSSPNRRIPGRVFTFREDSRFDGIISFLTQLHGGNVDDRSIVSVKSNSVYSDRIAKNVVDFESSLYAHTADETNSWIWYDFKDKRVKVSHYSLRSRSDNDSNHPMNLTVEGSKDGETWIEFDRRDECGDVVGLNRSGTFSTVRSEFVQHIRFRQHGKNSSGSNHLIVSGWELFGILHQINIS
jgi:hypothetical protein